MRLLRRFEEGEFDARSANGEGLLGGPPTIRSSAGFAATSSADTTGILALLDAREFRRSLAGGMGEGDDMPGYQKGGRARGRRQWGVREAGCRCRCRSHRGRRQQRRLYSNKSQALEWRHNSRSWQGHVGGGGGASLGGCARARH